VPLDREQYREDVLKPARQAGNVPPPDLYVRYGLPSDLRDPAAFADRIAEVVGYWQQLTTQHTYARLAETLIAAHRDLEHSGRLTPDRFAELHADARREQMQRLIPLAEAEAGAATHVGPAAVARIRLALGGAVTEAEIEEALSRSGVRIVREFPALPTAPHPKQANLGQYLRQLGQTLSAVIVFEDSVSRGFQVLGGFRLADGRRLDERAIAAARSRVNALPFSDPAKTPSENVLAILRTAERTPGELDALLLSEVVERLRPLANSGFVQRAVATQARELGLERDEAGLIAAALLATDTSETLRQQVEDELAGSRLRAAQWIANGLAANDPLRQRIAAIDANVTALSRRADQESAQGRCEEAARLLAEAIGIAGDDPDLSGRLAALPPPPPREAAARVDGDHVLVTWLPSPAAAGQLHYRVVRGHNRAPATPAEGTAVVRQTVKHDAIDTEAPSGVDLFYSVFASRGGGAWSSAATALPRIFTPDVADITVTTGDTSVTVSWRPHPDAAEVLVVRRAAEPPQAIDDGTPVEALLSGFTDTELHTGTEYCYRIVASYGTPGGQRRSPGVIIRAVPEPELAAVADLNVTMLGDGMSMILAIWTPPPYGQVRLVLCDRLPPWPPGTRLSPKETAGLRDILGTPRRGTDGRAVLEASLPPGRHHLLALTAGRNVTVAGSTVPVRIVEPVSGLVADRLHDEVQLAWVWPEGATDVLVRWPGGEHRCSRRTYFDEGGVIVNTGPAEATIEVRAVYPEPDGSVTSPPGNVGIPARGVAISYQIRRESRRHPRRRTIELVAEQDVRLPALVVVRSTGRYPPDGPAAGETIERIGPSSITPGQPLTVAVEPAKGPAWLACFADPGAPEPDAPGILLFPPLPAEMRIR
jgi:hypothetical protein